MILSVLSVLSVNIVICVYLKQLSPIYLNRTSSKHYKQITTRVVTDQLNVLASLMRRWNIFCAQSQKKQNEYNEDLLRLKKKWKNQMEQGKKIQLQKQIKQKQTQFDTWKTSNNKKMSSQQKRIKGPAQKLLQVFKAYRNVGKFSIYNSSINIEKQLLAQYKGQSADKLSLELQEEGILWFQQMRFNENIREKWGCNDFYQYFWFEIQKRLSAKQFSLQRLQNLKLVFYYKVKDTNIPGYYRFLNIRELFEKKASLLKFTKDFTDERMSDKLDQIIYSLKVYSLDCCRKRIENLFEKIPKESLQTKKKFTIMLNKMAVEQIEQGNEDKYMTTTLSEIDNKYLGEGSGQARKFIHSKALDKDLWSAFVHDNNQTVTFRWTAKEYLEINEINSIKQQFPKISTLEALEIYIFQNNCDLGKSFQLFLMKILKEPNTILKFVPYLYKPQTNINMRLVKMKGRSTFLSFASKKLNLKINFSQLIKLAKDRPNEQFFGQPFNVAYAIIQVTQKLIKQDKDEKGKVNIWYFDKSNPTTDFVIVSSKNQDQKSLRVFIESFDVTVTLEEKIILQKIQKAKNLFVQMIENPIDEAQFTQAEKARYLVKEIEGNLKFTVTHTIVCRRQLINNRDPTIVELKNGEKLIINFLAIEDIQIEYCTKPRTLEMYQTIKAISLQFSKQNYASSEFIMK